MQQPNPKRVQNYDRIAAESDGKFRPYFQFCRFSYQKTKIKGNLSRNSQSNLYGPQYGRHPLSCNQPQHWSEQCPFRDSVTDKHENMKIRGWLSGLITVIRYYAAPHQTKSSGHDDFCANALYRKHHWAHQQVIRPAYTDASHAGCKIIVAPGASLSGSADCGPARDAPMPSVA